MRRAMAVLVFVLPVAVGCGNSSQSADATGTSRPTIRPEASLTPREITLAKNLPGWLDLSTCKSLRSPKYPDIAASLFCAWKPLSRDWPGGVIYLGITARTQPVAADETIAQSRSAWSVNQPAVTPAPTCAEGPWVGRWDDRGELVGALSCTAVEGASIDYHWTDERTGLEASATFGSEDWAAAFRSWRQDGLDRMTVP